MICALVHSTKGGFCPETLHTRYFYLKRMQEAIVEFFSLVDKFADSCVLC